MTEKKSLPRKCLDSCEVPYLCAIACPLNDRLDEFMPQANQLSDVAIAEDEPLSIQVDDAPKTNAKSPKFP